MGDKILLVTESKSLQDSLWDHFTRWDHTPILARDFDSASRGAAELGATFFIIDNDIKSTDSLNLLRQLQHDFPWTESIFLVTMENMERGAKALEFGASDYLVKPVSGSRMSVAHRRARERLTVRTKLAVLGGQLLEDAPGPLINSVLQDLDGGSPCATLLYETQANKRQLFDEVPCYISVLGQDLRITEVNRRFREHFGDMVGEYRHDVYKGQAQEKGRSFRPIAETFNDGKSHQYERVVTAINGEQYNVLTYTAPLTDRRGEITHVMEISTNITEIRKLQDHLASLGMVMGSISHGIKGLLTALDGGMYSVRTGFTMDKPERISEGWKVVELMVGRIKRTVLDVLFYARDREVELDQVDVADFARQVATTGEYAAKKRPLIFESRISDDLGFFKVDPNALNPTLINLLENAVDACLEDSADKEHKITFTVHREDDVIVFDIEDNGMGMDQTTLDNMFTLFFTSKGSGGTGLGLFIANDTVRQHGGAITVDSEPGKGTHFHVRIPDRAEHSPGSQENIL